MDVVARLLLHPGHEAAVPGGASADVVRAESRTRVWTSTWLRPGPAQPRANTWGQGELTAASPGSHELPVLLNDTSQDQKKLLVEALRHQPQTHDLVVANCCRPPSLPGRPLCSVIMPTGNRGHCQFPLGMPGRAALIGRAHALTPGAQGASKHLECSESAPAIRTPEMRDSPALAAPLLLRPGPSAAHLGSSLWTAPHSLPFPWNRLVSETFQRIAG